MTPHLRQNASYALKEAVSFINMFHHDVNLLNYALMFCIFDYRYAFASFWENDSRNGMKTIAAQV